MAEYALQKECRLPFFVSFRHSSFRFLSGLSDGACSTNGAQASTDGLRSHGGAVNIVRKRETRITRASIAITVMFVLCHTPRVVPNVLEVFLEPSSFPRVRFALTLLHIVVSQCLNTMRHGYECSVYLVPIP